MASLCGSVISGKYFLSNTWHYRSSLRPLASFLISIFVGYVSDKLGNYKILTVLGVILAGTWPFGLLWLYHDHKLSQVPSQHSVVSENTTMILISESLVGAENAYTFPLMVILIMMGVLSSTSNVTLMDATGLAIAKKYSADFARQRLWGMFYNRLEISTLVRIIIRLYISGFGGMVLSPILCGVLVERISQYLGENLLLNNSHQPTFFFRSWCYLFSTIWFFPTHFWFALIFN